MIKKTKKKAKKKVAVKKSLTQKQRLNLIIKALGDKKAQDLKVFEVAGQSDLWDYFIVCTGTSTTHISTLNSNMEKIMSEAGEKAVHLDKGRESKWVITDYADILVHIFDEQSRSYYSIEKLWGEKEKTVKKKKADKRGK